MLLYNVWAANTKTYIMAHLRVTPTFPDLWWGWREVCSLESTFQIVSAKNQPEVTVCARVGDMVE